MTSPPMSDALLVLGGLLRYVAIDSGDPRTFAERERRIALEPVVAWAKGAS